MQLIELVRTSQQIAATSSRLAKIEALASCIRQATGPEVELAVAYLIGEIPTGRPGIGPSLVSAAAAASPKQDPELTLRDVEKTCQDLSSIRGAGSVAAKTQRLSQLFGRAVRQEQEFLVRLLLDELRQGALDGIMADAVAKAANVSADRVRRAMMFAGRLAPVASALLNDGPESLDRFSVEMFRPVQPMLAQTAGDVEEALGRLGEAALEYKLDGARIQVHKRDDEIRVFSRQLNEVTAAVPEVLELVRQLPARELMMDGEVLALRPDGKPHPFQTTMRRFGRKLEIDLLRQTLPLTPFFFDCLYLDGQSLMDEATQRRIEVMRQLVPPAFLLPRRVTADATEAGEFLSQAMNAGHEGLMAKALDAPYEAGSRGQEWLKIKPAHTLDLVILAAEWGSGRRQGWLSNLHLGARDLQSGGFAMIGKTFKGLTDEMLTWQTAQLLSRETERDGATVHVRPELVVEIAFNEVQFSPHYQSGLALRFARVKRYRVDKRASESDTLDTVRTIHARTHGSPTAG